jgi:hypothetical protein
MKEILMTRIALALLASSAISAVPANAAVTISGPSSESIFLSGSVTLGARYRNLSSGGGQEHFLGRNDLGVASNRVGADLVYANGNNAFSLSLAGTTLTSVMNGSNLSIMNAFGFAAAGDQPFDTMQLVLRDGQAGNGLIGLNGMRISGTTYGGQSVTDFALADIAAADFSGFRYFAITGLDFTKAFTLTGNFERTGSFSSSQELNRFDVTIGNGPITQAAVPEPASWAMLIIGFGLMGSAMRRRRVAAGAVAA